MIDSRRRTGALRFCANPHERFKSSVTNSQSGTGMDAASFQHCEEEVNMCGNPTDLPSGRLL